MSATDWSPVCPMPVHKGIGHAAIARATGSASKAARSPREPPPRTRTATSHSDTETALSALATEAGAPAPWTLALNRVTSKARSDTWSWPTKSLYPSEPGLATRPTRSGTSGTTKARLRRSSPSVSSVLRSAARRAGLAWEWAADGLVAPAPTRRPTCRLPGRSNRPSPRKPEERSPLRLASFTDRAGEGLGLRTSGNA